jgi:hypothetical protein
LLVVSIWAKQKKSWSWDLATVYLSYKYNLRHSHFLVVSKKNPSNFKVYYSNTYTHLVSERWR